jgi:hypothetical protein
MRRLSHILSFLVVALFLLLAGNVAKANTVDPKIVLGPTGSTIFPNQTDCAPSEIGSCFLPVDSTGFGIADITNNVGATIISDTVTIPFLSFFNRDSTPPVLTCATDSETAPGWTGVTSPDGQSCIFTGGIITSGHQYGLDFLGFCPAPGCNTDPNNPTVVRFDLAWTTAPVPEPGTIVLLGSGLIAAFGASRKRLKNAPNHAF